MACAATDWKGEEPGMKQAEVLAVDVRSLHQRVYDELKRALLQGGFQAGQTLTIRGISSVMGTSEMPVREAIKRLVAEKVIVQMSNRSFQVPGMSPGELQELIDLRIFVEDYAARRACAVADDRLISTMMRLNTEMQRLLEEGDKRGALRANQEFHFALYEAGNSPVLMEIIETLWVRCGPYLSAAMFSFEDSHDYFGSVVAIHQDIVRGLLERDEDAVVVALNNDLRSTAQWYLSHNVSQPGENTLTTFLGQV